MVKNKKLRAYRQNLVLSDAGFCSIYSNSDYAKFFSPFGLKKIFAEKAEKSEKRGELWDC